MMRRPDPAGGFAPALVANAAAAGVAARLVAVDRRDWASATFVGERQRIVLAAPPCPARTAWLAALPEAEIALRHWCVVDVALADAAGDPSRITLEALLIETR